MQYHIESEKDFWKFFIYKFIIKKIIIYIIITMKNKNKYNNR